MARTKAEVRAFLDSKVGTIVPHPGYPSLNGQCVTLTKALMEFLGVPNPYVARGDARYAGDNYLREGIADNGRGWLTVVVNRDMGLIDGVRYGHIWIDLTDEANYESNGARALYTTKNTRPITQGQQFVNYDKWLIGEDEMIKDTDNEFARWAQLAQQVRGRAQGFTREEFRNNAVGGTWLKAIESLSDDIEAYEYFARAQTAIAKVPVLEKKIQDLQNNVQYVQVTEPLYRKKG